MQDRHDATAGQMDGADRRARPKAGREVLRGWYALALAVGIAAAIGAAIAGTALHRSSSELMTRNGADISGEALARMRNANAGAHEAATLQLQGRMPRDVFHTYRDRFEELATSREWHLRPEYRHGLWVQEMTLPQEDTGIAVALARDPAQGLRMMADQPSITAAHDWGVLVGVACDGIARPGPDVSVSIGTTTP